METGSSSAGSVLSGSFEVAAALYELSTVVADVVLNHEYIRRKWLEEYILSISFLVFNGLVMGLLGVAMARKPSQSSRYCASNKTVNAIMAFVIGLLQLRVFTETIYVFIARIRVDRAKKRREQLASSTNPSSIQSAVDERPSMLNRPGSVYEEFQMQELTEGLEYFAFVQGIVRDMPIFIIQANATIHYRKWKFYDLWAVISTFCTLLRAMAGFISKDDKGKLRYATLFFLTGQFVFRVGAILLVATTKGLIVLSYGVFITMCSIIMCAFLKITHPSLDWTLQLGRAVMLFPFYTLFVIDGSKLKKRSYNTVTILRSKKLLALHGWRIMENCLGIALAITQPRYTDFGASTDSEIALIGCVCAAVYFVSAGVFWAVTFSLPQAQSSSVSSLLSPRAAGGRSMSFQNTPGQLVAQL